MVNNQKSTDGRKMTEKELTLQEGFKSGRKRGYGCLRKERQDQIHENVKKEGDIYYAEIIQLPQYQGNVAGVNINITNKKDEK